MVKNFQFRDQYGFDDLIHIMAILRSEDGCPWDREQDHKSIRANFIEETYEVVEAIDNGDTELLLEELGDVLLQVAFHARIEEERGAFTIGDVADGICKKLIVRHPHVFGEVTADTSAQVLKNWDEIKKRTKGQKNQTEVLESVPRVLPALMRSCKVQQKAAKVGFDWPDVTGAMDKAGEELEELREAVAEGAPAHCREELGDLLFSVVNIARFIDAEPEETLTQACDKFIKRFAGVEKLAQGRDMRKMSSEELDKLWNQAKAAL
jgi:tetrapyrrole methylase family protein / MazG family protein